VSGHSANFFAQLQKSELDPIRSRYVHNVYLQMLRDTSHSSWTCSWLSGRLCLVNTSMNFCVRIFVYEQTAENTILPRLNKTLTNLGGSSYFNKLCATVQSICGLSRSLVALQSVLASGPQSSSGHPRTQYLLYLKLVLSIFSTSSLVPRPRPVYRPALAIQPCPAYRRLQQEF